MTDWLLWQLADSAFPTGGFAHSGGLEAAWQQGEIRSRGELHAFIESGLVQVGASLVPFANETHANPELLGTADQLCDAFLSNHVANKGSRAQGQALLFSVERAFPSSAIAETRKSMLERESPGHLAPVFGSITRLLEVPHLSAVRLFLFMALRGYVSSAVRLGIVGPMEAQGLQHQLTAHAESVSARSHQLSIDDIAQTAPILEILHGAHDRLYSRLFQT